ncbi:hypothetical protein D3C86_1934730 [compost metagenome]
MAEQFLRANVYDRALNDKVWIQLLRQPYRIEFLLQLIVLPTQDNWKLFYKHAEFDRVNS